MEKAQKCCGQEPIVWRCNHRGLDFCGCDVEKIECQCCGRLVWGAGSDSVAIWNDGEDDEMNKLRNAKTDT